MAIGEQKSSGTWWKVLLGVLGGFFLGIGAVAGGVAIAGTVVKTKTLFGGEENASKFLGKDYLDKTVLEIVMDAVGGKIKVDTLGDLNNISPLVGEYVTGIKDALNDIGCELTNEEMYTWSISALADNVIGSVMDARMINVLSHDNIDYPDPVIKYLSYETENGEFVTDEQGHLKDHHLGDMLNNPNFVQDKVDSMSIKMLFTEEDIGNSPLLQSIKDKTVTELSEEGAFDDVKLDAVISVDSTSPKILKTFVENEVTVGGMGDAIDDLQISDVIEINESSPAILKTFAAKEVKVNEMSDAIDDLRLGEVMDLEEGDLLWKVRNDKITELNDIDTKLTIDDIMPDREGQKFIGAIEGTTTINKIGEAVNDMKLLKAFEDNIYEDDGAGNYLLNSTWKYMLIEDDEPWISGKPNKNTNPFATRPDTGEPYNCTKYTVGGDGTDGDEGINGLITNMSNNMERARLSQLSEDGIVELSTTFLEKPLGAWKALVPSIATDDTKVKMGDLTLKELSQIISAL